MKKIFTVCMVFLLLLTISATALASTTNGNADNLKRNADVAVLIASGDNYLIGGGIAYDDPSTTKDAPLQWSSGGSNHTHQYLTSRALTILKNDKGDNTANLLINYSSTLLTNSDWPDKYEKDGGLYIGHFYNPDTRKSIFNRTSPTAMSRFVSHTQKAKTYYTTNKTCTLAGRSALFRASVKWSTPLEIIPTLMPLPFCPRLRTKSAR